MADLVLTVLGDDRPGLVQAVSAPVESLGGSWRRSQLTRLGGKFAGVVLVTVPDGRVEELGEALRALADHGLEVRAERAGRADVGSGVRVMVLSLLGADRPGIVAEISTVLAELAVDFVDLDTDVFDAPMAGGTLFEATATLSLPTGTDPDEVQAVLERLADELMVDLSVEEPLPGVST